MRKDPARCFDLFYRTGLARTTDPTCFEELVEYADELADYKRSHPGDDIGTLLLRSVDSGQLQGQRELRSMILSVLGAGHVTTVQSVGCAVLRLLENPDQLASIFAGSPSWAQSVNEMLRYDSPIQATVNRYATEDMRIGEVDVAKGDVVLISIAAANRDPERFEDPERFDVTRPSRSNLAFGHGTHLCLGAHLARIEGEVALEMLFRQLKDLRLAIDPAEVVWSYGPMLRGPRELPVTFSR
ncbi:cytochrome P450 [Streptomyces noursei]|uniref:cytochrome P450 n=1 Tax=Streptomyces noursei TaxID=1971 RepID=UPI0003369FBC|nr:cytochrome P450 [Streptomyces noursei]